ncbi:MAG TPA: very short patch repair endonuclease, partial [Chthonomonadaceae bacterium]|nr:very short patch repair endonuclease [Chthonomonadaceae bacterium]
MADNLDPGLRRYTMSRVRDRNTTTEMFVRSLLHRMGYRFRLHRRDLPGKPDIVLPKYKTAIFVHGCFWHQHPGCRKAVIPAANRAYWSAKLARNVARDARVRAELQLAGWKMVIVWGCEVGARRADILAAA